MMITHIITEVNNPLKRKLQLLPSPLQAFRQRAKAKFRICGVVFVLVVVLENPDRFAIRLTKQISCRTSVSCGHGIPMHRGRARRRARGRFQISEFGFNLRNLRFQFRNLRLRDALSCAVGTRFRWTKKSRIQEFKKPRIQEAEAIGSPTSRTQKLCGEKTLSKQESRWPIAASWILEFSAS